MITFKCKMCGGDLHPEENATTCECEYCGSVQTIPTADNEKKGNLFNRANRLRMAAEYDKAASVYTSITAEFPEEAEAYWGLCLCKYGIEYVEDPVTAKKIPTCHRTRSESIMDDPDFDQACENADAVAMRVYREEAKAIDRLQQDILSVVANESPYDVFICYKETDDDGQRTEDSVLAQDIYDALTAKGLKVFFARITLEDKLGQQYEPYIYAALHSAKVMLAIGTQFEYFDAVWVKNEWSRFLDMMKSDKSKTLIPCYKDIDAYDMPREFKNLQAQDMGKLGWLQDLTRGVVKLCGKENAQTIQMTNAVPSAADNTQALLTRARMFVQDGEWAKAGEYIERVLDQVPTCSEAYLLRLMTACRCVSGEKLSNTPIMLDQNRDYQRALEFADSSQRTVLEKLRDKCMRNALRYQVIQLVIKRKAQEEKRIEEQTKKEEEERKQAAVRAQIAQFDSYRKRFDAFGQLFDVVDGGFKNGIMVYIKPDQTLGLFDVKRNKPIEDYAEAESIKIDKELFHFVKAQTEVRSVSYEAGLACILNDGMVHSYYYSGDWNTDDWHDIISVSQYKYNFKYNLTNYLFGLHADGTVVVTGREAEIRFGHLAELHNVESIIDISIDEIRYMGKDGRAYRYNPKDGGEPKIDVYFDHRHVMGQHGGIYVCADFTVHHSIEKKFTVYFGNPQNCIFAGTGSNDMHYYMTTQGNVYIQSKTNRFEWKDIVSIRNSWNTILALTNQGKLLYYQYDGIPEKEKVGELRGIRLFNDPDKLEEERREAKQARDQRLIVEKQRLEQEKQQKQRELESLRRQLTNAQDELSEIKGLFTGKRRRVLETTITDLRQRIIDDEKWLKDHP